MIKYNITTSAVSISGSGVSLMTLGVSDKPSLLTEEFMDKFVELIPDLAPGILTGLAYEKGNTDSTIYTMLDILSTVLPHSALEEILLTVESNINVDTMPFMPIQNIVKDAFDFVHGKYMLYTPSFKLPSLGAAPGTVLAHRVVTPEPVKAPEVTTTTTTVTSIEVTEVEVPTTPQEEGSDTTATTAEVKRDKGLELIASMMEKLKPLLKGKEKLEKLVVEVSGQVIAMMMSDTMNYDKSLLDMFLSEENLAYLKTLTLRDVVPATLIPKRFETIATCLVELAGVEAPTPADIANGYTILGLLKVSPKLLEELAPRMTSLFGTPVSMETIEEVFSKDEEISPFEMEKIRESYGLGDKKETGTEPSVGQAVQDVEARNTSLGNAMSNAFKGNAQRHHKATKGAK